MSQNNNSKKNIATFCSYVPNEIIHAAGLNPIRIIGNGKPTGKSKSYLPTYMCSFAMNCLDTILENRSEFDAYIFVNSCHAMESMFETSREFISEKFTLSIDVPRNSTPLALDYFYKELVNFKDSLEKIFNLKITDENLKNSIRLYNYARGLRSIIEQQIIEDRIILTTDEIIQLNQKSAESPEIFIEFANKIVDKSKDTIEAPDLFPRIMVTGSVLSPLDIIHVIDEYGGKVVLCDNCYGFRCSQHHISEEIEPLKAIASAYLCRTSCSRQCESSKKTEEFLKKIDDYKIDGVIFSMIKFCPDQSYGAITLTDILKQKDIPFLVIDDEYSDLCSGQIHTRIQAFLERF
jgi:benzoyl-CoA reductase subunit C